MSIADDLIQLDAMRASGLVSEAEWTRRRQRVIRGPLAAVLPHLDAGVVFVFVYNAFILNWALALSLMVAFGNGRDALMQYANLYSALQLMAPGLSASAVPLLAGFKPYAYGYYALLAAGSTIILYLTIRFEERFIANRYVARPLSVIVCAANLTALSCLYGHPAAENWIYILIQYVIIVTVLRFCTSGFRKGLWRFQ